MQWLLEEDGIIVDVDLPTRQQMNLKLARVKIRTESFKFIHGFIPCQFGTRKFSITIEEVNKNIHRIEPAIARDEADVQQESPESIESRVN